MAVVNVKRMWSQEKLKKEGNALVAERYWSVLVDDPATDPIDIIDHPDLPKEGDQYAVDNPKQMRLRDKEIERRQGPMLWVVKGNYDSSVPTVAPSDNPLDDQPIIEYDGAIYEEEADTDVNGKPLRNTAGDPIRGLTRETTDRVIRVTMNLGEWNDPFVAGFVSKINSEPVLGVDKRKVKLNSAKARLVFERGVYYWQAEFEFQHRKRTWGWLTEVLSLGRNQIVAGNKKTITLPDDNGNEVPVADPQMLTAGGAYTTNPDNCAHLIFELFEQADFRILGFA